MTVGCDESAVKTEVTCLHCGNDGDFSAHQITLGDAVLFVHCSEEVQLVLLVSLVIVVRRCRNHDIEAFTVDGRTHRAAVLLVTEVRQNVGDVEDRIVVVFTDADINGRAVVLADSTVNCQRNGNPLPLLDTAIIVCL